MSALATGTASAAYTDCKYLYSTDGKSISSSGTAADCLTGHTSTTYTAQSGAPSGEAIFVHKDGSCQQTLIIQDTGNPSSAQLSGNYPTSGNNKNCTGFPTVAITVSPAVGGNTGDTSSEQDIVYQQLQNLVDKHCNIPSVNDQSACVDKYQNWIGQCTQSTLSNIKSSDKNPNQEFIDQFSACLAKKSKANNGNMTAKEIAAALDPEIYNEITNPADSSNTSGDTCDTSSSPITWILCPIYDGLANLSDAILNGILVNFLQTKPVTTNTKDPVYQIWSSFRIYGNVLLVIGLLVIVFGESIGGGIIDAYTAKKVLPRLLIAAILINLSIYIVAVLVDITNILGEGIGNIITAPLHGVSLSPSGWKLGIFAASSVAAAGITTIAGVLLFSAGLLGTTLLSVLPFIFLFVIIPTALAIFLVFMTLVFRQALILALILVSPVAFALYCLPNTEKYFRMWWDLLWRTLMIYPIVMVVFAVSDVLAYTAVQANGTSSFWGYLIAFMLQFMPLFLIPFSFKIAGGVLGRIHDFGSSFAKRGVEGIKGNPQNPFSWRNRAKNTAFAGLTRGQQHLVDERRALGASRTRRFVGGVVGRIGSNVDDRSARYNAEAQARRKQLSDTWNDDPIFAGAGFARRDASGTMRYYSARFDENAINPEDGSTGYNQEISKAAYDDGKRNYGSTNHEINDSLTYALGKSQSDGQNQAMRRAFARNAQDRGMSQGEIAGSWAQVTYPHKVAMASEWYSTPKLQSDGSIKFEDVGENDASYHKMLNDIHKSRASFQLSNLRDVDWRAMHDRMHGANGYVTKLKAGQALTAQEASDFVMTNEILDTATQQGFLQRDSEGEVHANGASAAAKPIIESLAREKAGWDSRVTPGNPNTRQIVSTLNGPLPFGVTTRPKVVHQDGIVVTGDTERTDIPRSVDT